MADRARRPFWMHQAAEYLIGFVLIAQSLQGPDPVIPAVAGVVVMLNAAIVTGPLAAFRAVNRAVHRVLDVVLIGALAALAVLPFVPVDITSRLLLVLTAAVLASLWWYTDFAERAARRDRRTESAGERGERVGRSAGRLAGQAVSSVKRRRER